MGVFSLMEVLLSLLSGPGPILSTTTIWSTKMLQMLIMYENTENTVGNETASITNACI